MTSSLFAFQNLLRCASWPVMHDKHSRACPALVLHAGRAAKRQLLMVQQACSPSKHGLFCTSKNPWGNGAKGRAELAPTANLQRAREPQGARAQVAPWRCESSRQEPRRKGPEDPDKGLCSMLQRTRSNPRGPPWRPTRDSRKLPPPGCGARGPPSWSRSSRHLAKMAQRSPGRGRVLSAAEEGKKPPGTLASPPWGKKKSLPPPSCRARQAIFVVHEQQAVT